MRALKAGAGMLKARVSEVTEEGKAKSVLKRIAGKIEEMIIGIIVKKIIEPADGMIVTDNTEVIAERDWEIRLKMLLSRNPEAAVRLITEELGMENLKEDNGKIAGTVLRENAGMEIIITEKIPEMVTEKISRLYRNGIQKEKQKKLLPNRHIESQRMLKFPKISATAVKSVSINLFPIQEFVPVEKPMNTSRQDL